MIRTFAGGSAQIATLLPCREEQPTALSWACFQPFVKVLFIGTAAESLVEMDKPTLVCEKSWELMLNSHQHYWLTNPPARAVFLLLLSWSIAGRWELMLVRSSCDLTIMTHEQTSRLTPLLAMALFNYQLVCKWW